MSEEEIPFGRIQGVKIIRMAWGDCAEREIGEIKDGDLLGSTAYFEQRFEDLEQKIAALEKTIDESDNKGSYLMKLLHLKDLLPTHDGLGDYQSLQDRLEQKEEVLKELILQNREKNTLIKQGLIEEAQASSEKINWREATEDMLDIKTRWIKTGNVNEDIHHELEKNFWEILSQFFDKKQQFYEDKKRLQAKRKKDYVALVKDAQRVGSLFGKVKYDLIKELKEQWEAIGNIPKDDFVPLLKAFNAAIAARNTPAARAPQINLETIKQKVADVLLSNDHFQFNEFENLKKDLRTYRPTDLEAKKEKKELLQQIQIAIERDFVDKLARKRFKDYSTIEKGKKQQIRIGIVEELLTRDHADLEKYLENSANFSGVSQGMLEIIDKKLTQQKMKIATKEALIDFLKKNS